MLQRASAHRSTHKIRGHLVSHLSMPPITPTHLPARSLSAATNVHDLLCHTLHLVLPSKLFKAVRFSCTLMHAASRHYEEPLSSLVNIAQKDASTLTDLLLEPLSREHSRRTHSRLGTLWVNTNHVLAQDPRMSSDVIVALTGAERAPQIGQHLHAASQADLACSVGLHPRPLARLRRWLGEWDWLQEGGQRLRKLRIGRHLRAAQSNMCSR